MFVITLHNCIIIFLAIINISVVFLSRQLLFVVHAEQSVHDPLKTSLEGISPVKKNVHSFLRTVIHYVTKFATHNRVIRLASLLYTSYMIWYMSDDGIFMLSKQNRFYYIKATGCNFQVCNPRNDEKYLLYWARGQNIIHRIYFG